MSQPWQALEQLNDVASSYLSWRLLLGDAFDSHSELLVPIKDLAAALPVPNRPYEWLEIFEVEDDDPQTDESARSLSQCANRESILAGAVLGLAGPGNKITTGSIVS